MSTWDQDYRSGEYIAHWDYKYPSQELVATIATLALPRGSVALDVGCGAGREAIFLAKCGYRVHGVDFSKEALKIARKRASEQKVSVHWHKCDVTKLAIASRSVDFVNDRGCFHVIPDGRRQEFATELARVMKSGGHCLLRGSSRRGPYNFVPVNRSAVDRFFGRSLFSRGPVLPIALVSNGGTLSSNLVVLTRV